MLHRYLSLLTSEPISKVMSSPGMRDLNRSGAHDAGDPLEHTGTLSLGTCYGQNEYFFRFMTMALFACFFFRVFVQLRIFHSYGDASITGEGLQIIIGEGLQILTFTRHSWPLNSESCLACHTYCDTGHSFIMVISEDLQHSHLLPSV